MNRFLRADRVRFIPALCWMALIFYLSSRSKVPNPTNLSVELIAIAGHLVSFGILFLLLWYALGTIVLSSNTRFLVAFLVTVGYGVVDEIHQAFVPGRHSSVLDVLTDAVGAGVIILILLVWKKIDKDQAKRKLSPHARAE